MPNGPDTAGGAPDALVPEHGTAGTQSTQDWTPPLDFDVVKELNSHVGRVATLLGLLIAATTFSLGSSSIREPLASFDYSAFWGDLAAYFDIAGLTLLALLYTGASLLCSAAAVLRVLWNPIPDQATNREAWRLHIVRTSALIRLAVLGLAVSAWYLAVAWMAVGLWYSQGVGVGGVQRVILALWVYGPLLLVARSVYRLYV
jgi:hypothetical protein